MSTSNDHLLTGYRILDLTRALAGPTCTRMFAECGAEVIKIESAPNGDMTRAVSKFGNERSLYYVQQNLNKKSVCMDLRKPESIAIIKELVMKCDVVVENFKPGVIDKMGLGYDVLKALKKDIILCSISAMGQTGPLANKPGYDYIAQAYSGVTSMIGEPDQPPYIPLVGLGDVSTGVTAAFSIAAALLNKARTGEGQHLDIALLDCYYHFHEVNVHQFTASNGDINPHRSGRHASYVCPAGVYQGSGGDVMIMAFLHHWADLCNAMDNPALVNDPRFLTDADRVAHLDELIPIIETWLQSFPDISSAVEKMEQHGVPCSPILSVAETVEHPHFLHRGTVRTVRDPIAGDVTIPGMPVKSSAYAENQSYTAPTLGQHNAEVMQELLGKSAAEIEGLENNGVFHQKAV